MISVAVEPKTKADQEKMGMALGRLAQEDPTFKVHTDPDSGQTIISGMGELHLEIIVDRMMREYKVEANVGKPQVAYRETIRKHSEAEGKYIRQTGGRGQYGHAKIKLDPQPAGTGYEFVNDIVGGSVPKEFIKPIDQGIQEALEGGILAGYPMVDVKATLYDGSYHDVDSNEMAFKIAGSMAFKEAARKASPVLLEPVMSVEVVTPEDYAGVIMGDLSSRRGRIEGMEHRAGSQVIKAMVPLAEMFGYATHMRSSTQGRAEYSMHFARYGVAPRSVAEDHRQGAGNLELAIYGSVFSGDRYLFVHSPGEWKRILDADAAGAVAQLADEERLVAKRLGVEEKEVADKIKAGQYGELKLKAKGLSLEKDENRIRRLGTGLPTRGGSLGKFPGSMGAQDQGCRFDRQCTNSGWVGG